MFCPLFGLYSMTIATNHALSDKNPSNVGCMRVVNEPARIVVLNPGFGSCFKSGSTVYGVL